MDKFVIKKRSDKNTGHEGCVPPDKRAKQYNGDFYASGDRLFCRFCNVTVNHNRKSTVDAHLVSAKHKEAKEQLANSKEKVLQLAIYGGFLQLL